jgi:SAM-dependent methyltransferase
MQAVGKRIERSCRHMRPYTGFALVYDAFMDHIPYDAWADYVEQLLHEQGIIEGLVLELGCGTGSMTKRLLDKGYDMIGIDASEEMLTVAREKNADCKDSILYVCQDMREFELYGTVAAVISVCDSINYILTEEDLLQVFRLVNNYLDPHGIFIFDLDTSYEYEEILGDQTVAESREEGCFIWENAYYAEDMINEVTLTLFLPVIEEDAELEAAKDAYDQKEEQRQLKSMLYTKQEEIHCRRAYSLDTIKSLIEKAGMEWVTAYDAFTHEPPKKDSERVYIIAREKKQKGKYYLS